MAFLNNSMKGRWRCNLSVCRCHERCTNCSVC